MHDGPQDYEIVNEDVCLMAVTGGTGPGTGPSSSEAPSSRTPSMQSSAPAGQPSPAPHGISTALHQMPTSIMASAQDSMATQELVQQLYQRGWNRLDSRSGPGLHAPQPRGPLRDVS